MNATNDVRAHHGRFPAAISCMIALAVVACARSDTAEAKCGQRTKNVTINILATAENIGEFDECGCKVNKKGGLSRRKTFVDSVLTANDATLIVDGGDWADLNPDYGPVKNDFILRTMTDLGYDAMTLGRREIEMGWDHIRSVAGPDGPKLLASNLVLDGKRVVDDMMIRDVGCVRVGTFGLVGETILAQARNDQGVAVEDVYTTSDRVVEALRAEGCEVIVLLAQTQLATADSLLRRHPDIDVAVLGYRGGLRRTHATVGESIIVRPGRRGQYIGLLELEVDPEGKIVSFGGESLALGENIEKDAEVEKAVKQLEIDVERIKNEAADQAAAATPASGT